jgi:nitrite reductase/ring-hydroxylating ferredoxin subunit
MSRTVFKYALDLTDDQLVRMPTGAEVIHVNEQDGNLCIWVTVDPHAPMERRRFFVHGTGHEVNCMASRHIGSAHLHGGKIVLHVFE